MSAAVLAPVRSGRPLRFLWQIVGGWAASRLLLLMVPLIWVRAEGAPATFATVEAVFPIAEVVAAPLEMGRSAKARIGTMLPAIVSSISSEAAALSPEQGGGGFGTGYPGSALAYNLGFIDEAPSFGQTALARFAPGTRRQPVETAIPAQQSEQNRWRGSAWVLWRPGGGEAVAAAGGQLGGSQAGARLDYAIGSVAGGEFGAYGRLSAAMGTPHAGEGALGLAWRPSHSVPATLAVERRQRLSAGGRSAMAAYVAGGLNPTSLGRGMELEGYGQAGIVGFAHPDAFVDGKLSVTRQLTRKQATRDIAVGASLSGGAQPGASRLDIGPEVRVRLPVGKGRARLSAEWRERVAGDARPGSGPAFTLIGEF